MLFLASGLILLAHSLRIRLSWVLVGIIFALVLLICLGGGWLGQKIATLGIALVSPVLAISWLVRKYEVMEDSVRRRSSVFAGVGLWVCAVGITLSGGLMISASLISTRTLLQIDSFTGVKLALYLPILLALLIGVQVILPKEKRRFADGVAWLLNVPVKIWHVLLGIVALIGLFVMIDRSGNFPVIEVAEWENRVRGWLETMLYARPRTKEAFIGHPALVLGLRLGLSRFSVRRPFAYAGLVIGSIALASLTNTFCHLHTPIELSIWRTLIGGVIGGVIGIVLGVIAK